MIDRRVLVVFAVLFIASSMSAYGAVLNFCPENSCDTPCETTWNTNTLANNNVASFKSNCDSALDDCVEGCEGDYCTDECNSQHQGCYNTCKSTYLSIYNTGVNACHETCTGTHPDFNKGQNVGGDESYLYDGTVPLKQWAYVPQSIPNPCQWTCAAGWKPNLLFTECVEDPNASYRCDYTLSADFWATAEDLYLYLNMFVCPKRPGGGAVDPCFSDTPSFYMDPDDGVIYEYRGDFAHTFEPGYWDEEDSYEEYGKIPATGTGTPNNFGFKVSGVCYTGIEGQYWVRAQGDPQVGYVDNPTDGYCFIKAHNVSWDNDIGCPGCAAKFCNDNCVGSQVDWQDLGEEILNCCGDDNNETNTTDYDCAYAHNNADPTYLCIESAASGWKWLDVYEDEGQIHDALCGNISVVSNGSFYYCGNYPSQNTDLLTEFGHGTGIDEVVVHDAEDRHGYGCFIGTDGFAKIAECEGSETFSDSGLRISSGDSVGSPPLFCVRDTLNSTDEIDYTRMTYDLDDSLGNDEACNSAASQFPGTKWTGTLCCGEPEPDFGGHEYYNDNGGNGGCWSSVYRASGAVVPLTNSLVANNEGNFEGCLIDDDDSLLGLVDNQTQTPLISNLDYDSPVVDDLCHMAGGDVSYCSFEGEWRDAQSTLFYQKKMNWTKDTGEEEWECCHASECWDGTTCIGDQTYNFNPTPVYGDEDYRCMEGTWSIPPLKHTWDNKKTGYCPNATDCLVDPTLVDPAVGCQPNGTYYDAKTNYGQYPDQVYYCENGTWTSRTKLIALALLDYADSKSPTDFTLFCDSYDNILNYYDYEIGKGSGKFADRYLSDCHQNDCVNDFCVLQYKNRGKVAFGTSLNIDVSNTDRSFLHALGISDVTVCNPAKINDGKYRKCEDTNVWYNHNQNSVIYLPETPETEPFDISWADRFALFREKFFRSLIGNISNQSTPTRNYTFFERTNIFTKLYADVYGSKQVFAFLEENKAVPDIAPPETLVDYLGVQYKGLAISGLAVSPCDLIRNYEKEVAGKTQVRNCDSTTVVFPDFRLGGSLGLVDAWPDLTSKLRLRK